MAFHAITAIRLGPAGEIFTVVLKGIYTMPRMPDYRVGLHDGKEMDALQVVDLIRAGDTVFPARHLPGDNGFALDLDHPVGIAVLHGGEERIATEPMQAMLDLPRI